MAKNLKHGERKMYNVKIRANEIINYNKYEFMLADELLPLLIPKEKEFETISCGSREEDYWFIVTTKLMEISLRFVERKWEDEWVSQFSPNDLNILKKKYMNTFYDESKSNMAYLFGEIPFELRYESDIISDYFEDFDRTTIIHVLFDIFKTKENIIKNVSKVSIDTKNWYNGMLIETDFVSLINEQLEYNIHPKGEHYTFIQVMATEGNKLRLLDIHGNRIKELVSKYEKYQAEYKKREYLKKIYYEFVELFETRNFIMPLISNDGCLLYLNLIDAHKEFCSEFYYKDNEEK